MVNVAINGFGRIGRLLLQAASTNKKINIVAINDLAQPKKLACLLKYDSVHGAFCKNSKIRASKNALYFNGKKIPVTCEKDPSKHRWEDAKVDVVAECTGHFRTKELATHHLNAGAKKVLISAPGKNLDLTVVPGVNEHKYNKKKHHIVSAASCTTNCVAPMLQVIHKKLRIKHAYIATTHAVTATQSLVDGLHHKDPRRGRSALANIIPTTTGAATAVEEVIPALKNKLDGYALRVPVLDGSIAMCTAVVKKKTTTEKINTIFENEARTSLKSILRYTTDPLVSTDIIGDQHSCIFDSAFTKVIDGTFINIMGWYDNEWGYAHRMAEVLTRLT